MSLKEEKSDKQFWWRKGRREDPCGQNLKSGSLCPACGVGLLEYDGLFILSCPRCNYVASSGAFT